MMYRIHYHRVELNLSLLLFLFRNKVLYVLWDGIFLRKFVISIDNGGLRTPQKSRRCENNSTHTRKQWNLSD